MSDTRLPRFPMRLVSLAVSLTLLAALYARMNPTGLTAALAACRPGWILLALALLVPLTLVPAWRLQLMMPSGPRLDFGLAVRLLVMASSLNLVMPAKTGDLAKAYYLAERGHLPGPLALALMVIEKALDLLGLLGWCLVGALLSGSAAIAAFAFAALAAGTALVGSRRLTRLAAALRCEGLDRHLRAWTQAQDFLRAEPARLAALVALTGVFWALQLFQLWCLVQALGAPVPLGAHLGLAPVAVLAGLTPFTLSGIGARDAAVVWLYGAYLPPATGAALGLLFTARYLVPAAVGLPFLGAYLGAIRRVRAAADPGLSG